MLKILVRIVALFLVPCLFADPARAAILNYSLGRQTTGDKGFQVRGPVFSEQALAVPAGTVPGPAAARLDQETTHAAQEAGKLDLTAPAANMHKLREKNMGGMLDYFIEQLPGFETSAKTLSEQLPEDRTHIPNLLSTLAKLGFLKTNPKKVKGFWVKHLSLNAWITSRLKIPGFLESLRKLAILKYKSGSLGFETRNNAKRDILVLQTQFQPSTSATGQPIDKVATPGIVSPDVLKSLSEISVWPRGKDVLRANKARAKIAVSALRHAGFKHVYHRQIAILLNVDYDDRMRNYLNRIDVEESSADRDFETVSQGEFWRAVQLIEATGQTPYWASILAFLGVRSNAGVVAACRERLETYRTSPVDPETTRPAAPPTPNRLEVTLPPMRPPEISWDRLILEVEESAQASLSQNPAIVIERLWILKQFAAADKNGTVAKARNLPHPNALNGIILALALYRDGEVEEALHTIADMTNQFKFFPLVRIVHDWIAATPTIPDRPAKRDLSKTSS